MRISLFVIIEQFTKAFVKYNIIFYLLNLAMKESQFSAPIFTLIYGIGSNLSLMIDYENFEIKIFIFASK